MRTGRGDPDRLKEERFRGEEVVCVANGDRSVEKHHRHQAGKCHQAVNRVGIRDDQCDASAQAEEVCWLRAIVSMRHRSGRLKKMPHGRGLGVCVGKGGRKRGRNVKKVAGWKVKIQALYS